MKNLAHYLFLSSAFIGTTVLSFFVAPLSSNAAVFSLLDFEINFNNNLILNLANDGADLPVNIEYDEKVESVSLKVVANKNFDFDFNQDFNMSFKGGLWEGDISVKYDAGVNRDILESFSGYFQHTAGKLIKQGNFPHNGDEEVGDVFTIQFDTFDAAQATKSSNRINKPETVKHKKNHFDKYSRNELVLTVNTDSDDITGLNYFLEARHSEVPEPLTILGSATALGLGIALKKRRKQAA